MNKFECLLPSSDHPLFSHVKDLTAPDPLAILVDLRAMNARERLKDLNKRARPFMADLSSGVIPEFYQSPYFKGAIFCAAYSPTHTYPADTDLGASFLLSLGLKVYPVKEKPLFCHSYIQVMAMLMGEALMAKEDQLAKVADLDVAMQLGANYPMGLLEWSQKSDLLSLSYALRHLKELKNDERYEMASILKQKANSQGMNL